MKTSRSKIFSPAFFFIFLAAAFILLAGLSKIPVWSADEGRSAEISREMLESGDFITPRFNYVDYFEKPILAFLPSALFFKIFGVGQLGVRFPGILAALLGILAVYWAGRSFFDKKTAVYSAIILITSVGYILVGRFGILDMMLTLWMSLSLLCLLKACLDEKRRLYLLAYVFMGLGFLTKGLVGVVLPLFIFWTFLIWTRNPAEVLKMRLGWGMLIVAAIFVPWGIAISMQEPEFSYVFIWQHHIARYSSGYFGRKRPLWFFVPIFFSLIFPWSFFLFHSAKQGLALPDPRKKKVVKFLISWMAVILVFFSIPRSKLPYYILPMSVPAALLIGAFFAEQDRLEREGRPSAVLTKFAWIISIFFYTALLGLNIFAWISRDPRAIAVAPALRIFSAVSFVWTLAYLFFRKKSPVRSLFFCLASMVYAALGVLFIGMIALSPYLSSYRFAEKIKPGLKAGDRVAIFSSPDHFADFPFHLRRRVVVVGSDRGTLTAESKDPDDEHNDKDWFIESSPFVRLFESSPQRIFCLMEAKRLADLKSAGLTRFETVLEDGGKILIVNHS